MRKMISNEKGITGIGIMFVLAIIAGVALITLRLFPLYNEKFQIVSALNATISRPGADTFTSKQAGKAFITALTVTNINKFDKHNIKDHLEVIKPKKKGEPRMLHLQYESRSPFFADIQFVLVFDKKMPLTGPSTGE